MKHNLEAAALVAIAWIIAWMLLWCIFQLIAPLGVYGQLGFAVLFVFIAGFVVIRQLLKQ